MTKFFIDSDVILDLLTDREPFADYAGLIFSKALSGDISLYTSPLVIANVHYIFSKFSGKVQSRKIIMRLLDSFEVLSVDANILNDAIRSGFNDVEDAIQYYTAVSGGVDSIVTRNIKDFRQSKIPVFSSKEACIIFRSDEMPF